MILLVVMFNFKMTLAIMVIRLTSFGFLKIYVDVRRVTINLNILRDTPYSILANASRGQPQGQSKGINHPLWDSKKNHFAYITDDIIDIK